MYLWLVKRFHSPQPRLSPSLSLSLFLSLSLSLSLFYCDCQINTEELQWLEQTLDHENWFQSKVVPASQGKFLYLVLHMGLLRQEFSCCYFFSIFSDCRSLKLKNENNSMKTQMFKMPTISKIILKNAFQSIMLRYNPNVIKLFQC